jgi:NADH:ubiquinone oxidoreductase subunit 4 (subunit M)
MVPLLIGIVWLGLYPAPVLKRMEASTNRYLEVIGPHRSGPDHDVKLGASVEARP